MTTAAIIQARMTSTRLPGKVLADICGMPLLARMIARVRRARSLDAMMVATTTNREDDPVADLCARLDVPVFRGDEADVLGRFLGAATDARAEIIVRLTADCPMIDPALIDAAIEAFRDGGHDYLSNSLVATYPDGLDVEVFTRGALERAASEATLPFHREHVTPYMRNGHYDDVPTGDFNVGEMRAPADFSHLRITVDTPDDLARVRKLVAKLPEHYGWMDVLALLTRQPGLLTGRSGETSPPVLRSATAEDSALLLDWVNRPDSLAGKLATSGPVAAADHNDWYAQRLADPDTAIWIAEQGAAPVGQVRVERRAAGLEVDVYVVETCRGGGLAAAMIEQAALACAEAWPGVPMIARVRPENMASRRLFARAGFGATRVMPDHLMMTREQSGTRAANG